VVIRVTNKVFRAPILEECFPRGLFDLWFFSAPSLPFQEPLPVDVGLGPPGLHFPNFTSLLFDFFTGALPGRGIPH